MCLGRHSLRPLAGADDIRRGHTVPDLCAACGGGNADSYRAAPRKHRAAHKRHGAGFQARKAAGDETQRRVLKRTENGDIVKPIRGESRNHSRIKTEGN